MKNTAASINLCRLHTFNPSSVSLPHPEVETSSAARALPGADEATAPFVFFCRGGGSGTAVVRDLGRTATMGDRRCSPRTSRKRSCVSTAYLGAAERKSVSACVSPTSGGVQASAPAFTSPLVSSGLRGVAGHQELEHREAVADAVVVPARPDPAACCVRKLEPFRGSAHSFGRGSRVPRRDANVAPFGSCECLGSA